MKYRIRHFGERADISIQLKGKLYAYIRQDKTMEPAFMWIFHGDIAESVYHGTNNVYEY